MCHRKKKQKETVTPKENTSSTDKIDKLRGNWEKDKSKDNKKEGSL